MAKKGKHKDDKAHGGRLPKRIAGVKVPKALRSGGAVRALAGNPLVRQIIAAALTAAAAAIAGEKGKQASANAKGANGGGHTTATGAIIGAFAAAATDIVRQLREGAPQNADINQQPAPHAGGDHPGSAPEAGLPH